MIEVTEEMCMAAYRVARAWAIAHGHQQPDDRMIVEILAAALAIAERDYALVDRKPTERPQCHSQRWGLRCDLPEGHGGTHSHARFETWS